MADLNEELIPFIKSFNKQWLNGSISPEIWNHYKSQKRTNNDLEGFHSKLTKFLPKYHPKFSDILNCINREDSKTTNAYLRPNKKSKQAKREVEKDLKILMIHEEFERNNISFKDYFDNLTHQVMSPYEQDLDLDFQVVDFDIDDSADEQPIAETSSKIKVKKLTNNYKSVNYIGDIENRLSFLKSEKKNAIEEVGQASSLKYKTDSDNEIDQPKMACKQENKIETENKNVKNITDNLITVDDEI
ncbi:unnamed protein product [Brachionus calyciflorus]|uniref:Uncharacterized protein n=1 Tax=Brachionus calyciflorus TaxID=104777 RepID=A0A814MTX8_9BILA|nr:unnamed protein product [Brachionus calyciflorus]